MRSMSEYGNRNRRALYIALLIVVSASSLTGCATIFKGSETDIPIIGPEEARFALLDTVESPILPIDNEDGDRFLTLSTDRSHRLTVLHEGRSDTLSVRRRFNELWLAADFPVFPVGYIVDGITGAWFDFDGVSIVYDSTFDAGDPTPIWLVRKIDRSVEKSKKRGDVELRAHIGFNNRTIQVPLVPPHFGAAVGYGFNRWLGLFATYETTGCIDLYRYEGDVRQSNHQCDMVVTTYGGALRFSHPTGLYAGAGMGWMQVSLDSLYRNSDGAHLAGFSDGLPAYSVGAGYMGSLLFGEVVWQGGTERVEVGPTATASAEILFVRFGMRVAF